MESTFEMVTQRLTMGTVSTGAIGGKKAAVAFDHTTQSIVSTSSSDSQSSTQESSQPHAKEEEIATPQVTTTEAPASSSAEEPSPARVRGSRPIDEI